MLHNTGGKGKKSKLKILRGEVKLLKNSITSWESRFEEFDTKSNEIQAKQKKYDSSIYSHDSKISRMELKLKTLKTKLVMGNKKIKSLEKKLTVFANKIPPEPQIFLSENLENVAPKLIDDPAQVHRKKKSKKKNKSLIDGNFVGTNDTEESTLLASEDINEHYTEQIKYPENEKENVKVSKKRKRSKKAKRIVNDDAVFQNGDPSEQSINMSCEDEPTKQMEYPENPENVKVSKKRKKSKKTKKIVDDDEVFQDDILSEQSINMSSMESCDEPTKPIDPEEEQVVKKPKKKKSRKTKESFLVEPDLNTKTEQQQPTVPDLPEKSETEPVCVSPKENILSLKKRIIRKDLVVLCERLERVQVPENQRWKLLPFNLYIESNTTFPSQKEEEDSEVELVSDPEIVPDSDSESVPNKYDADVPMVDLSFDDNWKDDEREPEEKSSSTPFVCNFCQKICSSQVSLTKHVNTHVAGKELQSKCPLCHEVVEGRKKFSEHMKIHTNSTPSPKGKLVGQGRSSLSSTGYQCSICFLRFSLSSHLNDHQRLHNRKDKFECEQCHRLLTSEAGLKRHLKVCPGLRKCPKCSKTFSNNGNFTLHVQTCQGSDVYVCETCSKEFTSVVLLRLHVKTHTLENVPCPKCDKVYKHRKHMRVHFRTHHTDYHVPSNPNGGLKHKCVDCDNEYVYKKSLVIHRKKKHTEEEENTDYPEDTRDEEEEADGNKEEEEDDDNKEEEEEEEEEIDSE